MPHLTEQAGNMLPGKKVKCTLTLPARRCRQSGTHKNQFRSVGWKIIMQRRIQ
jgi:hypothetical protein